MRVVIPFFVSLVIFVIGVVYTLNQPRIYEASGKVQLLRVESDSRWKKSSMKISELTAEEALDILDSASMVMGVTERLNERERERLSAPYAHLKDDKAIIRALYGADARAFNLLPDTNLIEVVYRHPDPEIAAIIANAHMKELIDYSLKLGIESSMRAAEDLRVRADQEKEAIANLMNELSALEANIASDAEAELNRIAKKREELKEKRISYQRIYDKMTNAKAVFRSGPGLGRVVDEAVIPTRHVSPNIPLWIACSLLTGLVSGVISFVLMGKLRS